MSKLSEFNLYDKPLDDLEKESLLITTLNAHSFNMSRKDATFRKALKASDVLLPDGISVVWAYRWLTGNKIKKIAGADLFFHEMEQLQDSSGSCFFLGSSDKTLDKIQNRAANEFHNVKVGSYSPPFKATFSEEDSAAMIAAVNDFKPDVLFIGLTAPKQEKWAYRHFDQLCAGHVCCIGAVFDFYAGTVGRAPDWMISIALEWLYRFVRQPGRMWRRYLIGNFRFIWSVIYEKYCLSTINTD